MAGVKAPAPEGRRSCGVQPRLGPRGVTRTSLMRDSKAANDVNVPDLVAFIQAVRAYIGAEQV